MHNNVEVNNTYIGEVRLYNSIYYMTWYKQGKH